MLEFEKVNELPCDSYHFFTHGGMIFLFCTSVVFFIVSIVLYSVSFDASDISGILWYISSLLVTTAQEIQFAVLV